MSQVVEACPACGGRKLALIGVAPDTEGRREEPFQLLRCADCTLTTASPLLSDEEVAPYYGAAFYGRLGAVGGALMAGFLRARRQRVLRLRRPPAVVLDVGCGDGRFLAALSQSGYACIGMEQSAAGRAAAATRVDRVVASLDEIDDGSIDVVTLWQVLEHIATPTSLLAALRRVMRPDAHLIVSVPNFESPEAQAFGDRWFHLDVPRHCLHFGPSSLTGLLTREGFDVMDIDTLAVEYNVFGLVQSGLNALPIERNALYRFAKRGEPLQSFPPGTRRVLTAVLAGLPALAGLAMAGSVASGLFGRGSTITMSARRR